MFQKSLLSPQIAPGNDFYHHVNQKWIDSHPIPPNKSSVATFTELSDENTERLKALLEKNNDTATHNIQLARDFYRAAMDETAIEKAGLKLVEDSLKRINDISTVDDVLAFITDLHAQGRSMLWNPEIEPDDKNSQRYLLRLHQGGLGMPDREYYLGDNDKFEAIQLSYKEFLKQLFMLLGAANNEAAAKADDVYKLETEIAKVSATPTERRDPEATYNLYSLDKLSAELPQVNWYKYLPAIGLESVDEILIAWPNFMKDATKQLEKQSISVWRNYLTFHYIVSLMDKLPKAYDELRFSFYGKTLSGAEEQEPRYRRVIRLMERILPEPLGQLYVESHFDEHAKQEIYDLVSHLKKALVKRIQNLQWMGQETKDKALEKLDAFEPLLGYPDKWKDHSQLSAGKQHIENYLAAIAFDWRYHAERINQPVDRKEWAMSPATVNAYYWANMNQITFPAGILQPPFFDATGDFAANYGGIGMVIGHEILHGFDDNGSKYDNFGNMNSWWTGDDQKAFDERVKKLEQQYSQYEVDGRKVNGKLTLGENIADLGGLLLAYDGLQAKLKETGKREPIDGLTPEQRFFINNAYTWGQNIRPELRMQYLITDPHSPNQFRINGVVVNCDAFYETFDLKPGDKLYLPPEQRVRIW